MLYYVILLFQWDACSCAQLYTLEKLPRELLQLPSGTMDELPQLMGNKIQSFWEHAANLMISICAYRLEDSHVPERDNLHENKQKAEAIPEHNATPKLAWNSTSHCYYFWVNSLAHFQIVIFGVYFYWE